MTTDADRIAELEAQLDALQIVAENRAMALDLLRPDATRYRWLRQGDNDEVVMRTYDKGKVRAFDARFDSCWLPRKHELDAAIDAALSAREAG
jgi:hypothetical protein